jgi:hypothetical protein
LVGKSKETVFGSISAGENGMLIRQRRRTIAIELELENSIMGQRDQASLL